MAKISGVDILLKVNTGTVAAPVWTTVGGQSGATLSRTTNVIDVTAKDAQGFTEAVPGMNSWEISGDAVLVEDDEALFMLETAWNDRQGVQVQVAMPSGALYDGAAFISDLSLDAPADDAATITISLTGNGPLTKTPAA